MHNDSWKKIFDDYDILKHDFSKTPFIITAEQIKKSTHSFKNTGEKEVRILCKQDCRQDRADVFIKNKLFLLPIKNGTFAIIKGEGYLDIPMITNTSQVYNSKLDFILDTSKVGNSEMQHLDFAYASSLVRTFLEDPTLVLTIRGRKYTPAFSFRVGKQLIEVKGVQTEVDAGYEGKDQIALIEAKNCKTNNVIIRQLFYPYRQWAHYTKKKVITLFFEKISEWYCLWQFEFKDTDDYNSISLVKSCKYKIVDK
ncbi:MAG: hypothetical protein AUJ89_01120 [Candidatus Omnitrophica bacterium CG1_02_43_210]|nr:MAG: hypothetical protein AUJ89_01120 [Candidatus Omnitrophica bacterium CG1_02_43_210]